MKVLAVNGSPRGPKSNTDRLLGPMLEGAREAGADVEKLYLNDLDIRPCTGCFSCWVATPGRCVQQDDMPGMLEKMLASDVLVLGFPLYIFGVPAGVQALLERMLPLVDPHLVERGHTTGHPMRYPDRGLRWVVLSNCGFPEQNHFDALMLKFRHLGVEPIVMGAGELLPAMEREPRLKEPLEALRGALREAGQELARSGDISQPLLAKLNRPVTEWAGISATQYRETGNRGFDEALKSAAKRQQGEAGAG